MSLTKGIDWAKQRDEPESLCLGYGQLAETYLNIGSKDRALDNFKKCYEIG